MARTKRISAVPDRAAQNKAMRGTNRKGSSPPNNPPGRKVCVGGEGKAAGKKEGVTEKKNLTKKLEKREI